MNLLKLMLCFVCGQYAGLILFSDRGDKVSMWHSEEKLKCIHNKIPLFSDSARRINSQYISEIFDDPMSKRSMTTFARATLLFGFGQSGPDRTSFSVPTVLRIKK